MTYKFDPILGAGRDGSVSLAAQQAGFDAGTAPEKAAFQASVSDAPVIQSALLGTNNIENGGFDSGAGWTLTAGFSIAGGLLTSSTNGSKYATNSATVIAGGIYILCWYQIGGGSIDTKIVIKTPADNFLTDGYIIGVGPRSLTFQAPVSGNISFYNYAAGCTYDNVVMLRIA